MSVQNAAEHQSQFAKDMRGQFSNSKQPQTFLDEYFPRKNTKNTRSKTVEPVEFPEKTWYDEVEWVGFARSYFLDICAKDG